MIPLPVEWIKNMRLGKGDSLRIEMLEDGSLKITPVPQDCQTLKEPGAQHLPPMERCWHE